MRRLCASTAAALTALVGAVSIDAVLLCSTPAAAATVDCIPAARLVTLARITDGSMSQLADLLGLPGKSPPEDGCRALLLSGPLSKGSAAALLAAIAHNKGWLAQVYIAVVDDDLLEEVEVAQLMRDFALAGVLLEVDGVYVPDFLTPPRSLPASISNSWLDAERTIHTPLALSFKDYLDNTDRKIRPGASSCGAGCWTILAGAIERNVRLRAVPMGPERSGVAQSPDFGRLRDGVRSSFGPRFGLILQPAGYRPTESVARFARIDRAAMEADCRPATEYVNALQQEVGKGADAYAAKGFPFMRLGALLPKLRRLQEASAGAELCMRKNLTRLRVSLFEAFCRDGCEAKRRAVEAAADKALRQASAGGSDRGSDQGGVAPGSTALPSPSAPGGPPLSPRLRPQRAR